MSRPKPETNFIVNHLPPLSCAAGEDPYLGFRMAQPLVRGIQSQGVVANAKHYVGNNQETDRGSVSANIDERTLHQIYLMPFEGAIRAGVSSVMCR